MIIDNLIISIVCCKNDEIFLHKKFFSGKSTVDSCPENYIKQKDNNQTIAELCGSYTAMVFEPNAAYRNVHCAICNNASLEKLICLNLGPFGRFNWQQNFNSFSFAVLFDISGNGNDQVGFVSCQSGELYDPFYKKCRNVICGQEGMEYRQGRCISTRVIFPTTTTSTTTTSAVKSSTIGTTKPDSTTRYIIFDEFSKFGSSLYAKNLRGKGRKKNHFSTFLLKNPRFRALDYQH